MSIDYDYQHHQNRQYLQAETYQCSGTQSKREVASFCKILLRYGKDLNDWIKEVADEFKCSAMKTFKVPKMPLID